MRGGTRRLPRPWASVALEAADSWIDQGHCYGLCDAPAGPCGTEYTESGGRRDCGWVSPAVLAAYIAGAWPVCAPLSTRAGTSYVACCAMITPTNWAWHLIASAFVFAAIRADVWLQYTPYVVVGKVFAKRRAGLWQFKVVERSAIVLGRARQLTGQGQ